MCEQSEKSRLACIDCNSLFECHGSELPVYVDCAQCGDNYAMFSMDETLCPRCTELAAAPVSDAPTPAGSPSLFQVLSDSPSFILLTRCMAQVNELSMSQYDYFLRELSMFEISSDLDLRQLTVQQLCDVLSCAHLKMSGGAK